ncbi:MAG: hypothetical protein KKA32_06355 [Actinobacteria bacterium]|nr:hypothetical protein [Actinomycetota bacterium]
MAEEDIERLRRSIADKQAYLEELQASLPAHTIRPHQLIEIEDTEEIITDLRAELARLAPE